MNSYVQITFSFFFKDKIDASYVPFCIYLNKLQLWGDITDIRDKGQVHIGGPAERTLESLCHCVELHKKYFVLKAVLGGIIPGPSVFYELTN